MKAGKVDWAEPTTSIEIVPIFAKDAETVPCLIVISGSQMGMVYRLQDKEARIGRAEDAHLSIRDSSISRYHAMIYFDKGGACRITDLGSTNGTFVNGVKVTDAPLDAGDRVQLGKSTMIKFEFHSKLEDQFHTQLYDAGTRDPLTGVFNRRYLEQHLDSDFKLAMRHEEPLSVLMIDVDHFKTVNDTHGHLAGDVVLRVLAQTLQKRLRGEDLLARYGGEEFVVLSRRTPVEGAVKLAESIRTIVADTVFSFQGRRIPITISLGISTLTHPASYKESKELLAASDAALYRAKQNGRNRVES